MRQWKWLLPVVLLFGFCYMLSLTFVYVDGDDASSIAYHLFGRNSNVYPQFARTQILLDYVLSALPVREPLLRTAAMSISATAAAIFAALALQLGFTINAISGTGKKGIIACVYLFAVPELFYLGLLYTPMLVGLCCILGAHLLLRSSLVGRPQSIATNRRSLLKVLLSGVLLGLGGLARWDLSLYGLAIVADIVFNSSRVDEIAGSHKHRRLTIISVWIFIAASTWAVGVLANGDVQKSFAELMSSMIETSEEGRIPLIQLAAVQQTLFTPAFVISLTWGLVVQFRKNRRLAFFCLTMLAPIIAWPFRGSPKELFVFFPVMGVCAVAGLDAISKLSRPSIISEWMRFALMIVIALLPWLVGLRATYMDSSWGPGFGLSGFDHSRRDGLWFEFTLGDPVAYPSTEGPRPIGAHASVLFGGKWRHFIRSLDDDRKEAVGLSLRTESPLVQIAGSIGLVACDIGERGYRIRDSQGGIATDSPYVATRFRSADGGSALVVKVEPAYPQSDIKSFRYLLDQEGARLVVLQGPPSAMRRVFHFFPGHLHPINRTTGVLDLEQLRAEGTI